MKKEQSVDLQCSFCGKHQREVRKLIAGPTVYICEECIKLCNDIIAEKERRTDLAPHETASPPKKEEAAKTGQLLCCSFCGRSQREVKVLIAGPSVYICDECIGLCNDIIFEEIDRAETANVLTYKLPEDVRALIGGILERGIPAVYRIRTVIDRRIIEAARRQPEEHPDEISVWFLTGFWRDLRDLARAPLESQSGGDGPDAAELTAWASAIADRLTGILEVLDALARSIAERGLEELRQLRPSINVAREEIREAGELLLAGPPRR